MRPTWTVELLPRAENALRKMDRAQAKRIAASLNRLAAAEHPHDACKALSGPLRGLWRYRVGDYRVIVDIRQGELVIVAVDVGHRSEIYD